MKLLSKISPNKSLKADPVPSGFFGFVLSFAAAPVGLAQALVRQAKLVASFRVKVPDGRASRMKSARSNQPPVSSVAQPAERGRRFRLPHT